jgi:hypothetical protein
MHGYPDLLPPGCRLPPPHDLMYGGGHHPPLPPPPDMVPVPPGGPMDLVEPPPDEWVRAGEGPPPPGAVNLYLPHPRAGGPPEAPEPDFTYLDTSDDSGRHTGPEPSSP